MSYIAVFLLVVSVPILAYAWGLLQWDRGLMDAIMVSRGSSPRSARMSREMLVVLRGPGLERDGLRAEVESMAHELEVQGHLAARSIAASEAFVAQLRIELGIQRDRADGLSRVIEQLRALVEAQERSTENAPGSATGDHQPSDPTGAG